MTASMPVALSGLRITQQVERSRDSCSAGLSPSSTSSSARVSSSHASGFPPPSLRTCSSTPNAADALVPRASSVAATASVLSMLITAQGLSAFRLSMRYPAFCAACLTSA